MVVERRIKRMPWAATGRDVNRHDEFCRRLDEILIDEDFLDDSTYWCIINHFHEYMAHATYENEYSLGSYLFNLDSDEEFRLDLLSLYDEMKDHINSVTPHVPHPHDYTQNDEIIYTLFLNTEEVCFYTTISRN